MRNLYFVDLSNWRHISI